MADYQMTKVETAEAARLQSQIDVLVKRIVTLTPRDSLIDALPWDGTGNNGSKSARRIGKRRAAYLDRTIDAAAKIAPLVSQRNGLQIQQERITSGQNAREAARATKNVQRAHTLKVGDTIATEYGVCPIIRVNTKTLSIRTPMGRTERIPYTHLS